MRQNQDNYQGTRVLALFLMAYLRQKRDTYFISTYLYRTLEIYEENERFID